MRYIFQIIFYLNRERDIDGKREKGGDRILLDILTQNTQRYITSIIGRPNAGNEQFTSAHKV